MGVDQDYLDFDHHKVMLTALSLMAVEEKDPLRVLVLGGRGAVFSQFLYDHLSNV